ncbi:unnamed protein product [Lymnaea stagnalis]|uniref:Uncharacterized protein n=1 Tax=Lymnaea stagnalis TaxID=6523 RepID=A0AAV2I1U6_LYMST
MMRTDSFSGSRGASNIFEASSAISSNGDKRSDVYRPLGRTAYRHSRFFVTGAIVTQADLYKPRILTSLIKQEKIKDINSRMTRPTEVSIKPLELFSQEYLLNRLAAENKKVLYGSNGELKPAYQRPSLCAPEYHDTSFRLPPAPASHPIKYHTLWHYPSRDSIETKWRSHQRNSSVDFLQRRTNASKMYSVHKPKTI